MQKRIDLFFTTISLWRKEHDGQPPFCSVRGMEFRMTAGRDDRVGLVGIDSLRRVIVASMMTS